ncbi:MAG TPA: type I-E CRISPR-associated protein Cas5/CasD [Arsenophonus sp.]
MTYRYYLQDCAFTVLLAVLADLLATSVEALQNPLWDLALGRKNCVPTEFIFQGQFPNLLDAGQAAEKMASEKQRVSDLKVVSGLAEGGEILTLMISL